MISSFKEEGDCDVLLTSLMSCCRGAEPCLRTSQRFGNTALGTLTIFGDVLNCLEQRMK